MMCLKPFKQGVLEYGCGQCMPCRINRRRLWTSRLMLEAAQHEFSLFVTLTYSNELLPTDGSLVPKHLQDFLKRLRERVEPNRVRFFGVGEYGDRTFRPHYHVLLFGRVAPAHVGASWRFGFVHCGSVSAQSIAYVAGYVVKGLTKSEDVRLGGRRPEFCRMSLRPGIGALNLSVLTAMVEKYGIEDVPTVVRADNAKWPLGRYLRRKMRLELGRDPRMPEELLARRASELQLKFSEMGTSKALKTLFERRRAAGWRAWRLNQIASSRKDSKRETI